MDKEIWRKPKVCSNIGGEALIEGVMMRGNNKIAMSVRKTTGEIYTETKPSVPVTKKHKFLGLPFIRGGVSLIESMLVGVRVLMESAELVDFTEEDEKESKFDLWMKKWLGEKYFSYMIYFSVVIALAFSIGLFMLLPNFIAGLFSFDKQTTGGALLANLIEGVIRISLFILYVFLVSKNKEIKRVFQYHGAEHKTIYAYENEEELTVENVRKHTTLHPRCGTTFMFIVIIISIIVFAFAGWHNPLINMLLRLALLPVIAGISYEAFKLSARSSSKFVRLISIPGLMLQKITTQEPDDSMLEVAIASLKAVLQEAPDTEENSTAVPEGAL
ncbi:MAG: DUF1385 domain-containing protein [Clostridiaceae bacterium]|jgi:uncharacterized protein YqhQ|nr:DUF1385 domain-containing protein [Clostridiaceae bacterium]